jgi:hypothetical protein
VIDRSAAAQSWGSVQAATTERTVKQASGLGGLVITGGKVIAEGQVISPTPVAEPPSVADQLAKLADLKNQGALTESEFQAQKQKLLGT